MGVLTRRCNFEFGIWNLEFVPSLEMCGRIDAMDEFLLPNSKFLIAFARVGDDASDLFVKPGEL
jgi:hypothetical protein